MALCYRHHLLPSSTIRYEAMEATHSTSSDTSQTIYVPIASPPTPAPSPRPVPSFFFHQSTTQSSFLEFDVRRQFASLDPSSRKQLLLSIISDCTPSELLFISTTIAPLLKRDFLHELPPELALHVLTFIDDPRTLTRASQVSRSWNALVNDEGLWKRLCYVYRFEVERESSPSTLAVLPKVPPNGSPDVDEDDPLEEMEPFAILPMDPALQWLTNRRRRARREQFREAAVAATAHITDAAFSFHKHFKTSYQTSGSLSFLIV
jgi:F-box and WD-40 domain protein CDC4